MSLRSIHWAVLCLGLFLVFFTISVGKPGLPPTLKADEPAYFLMSLSLVHDQDLKCETRDYQRLFQTYAHLPTENLIVMSDDDWETVYFSKPYLYSLLAAPLAAAFGANGLVAFNMILFVALIWMGAVYLSRFNDPPVALFFSIAFFFLSPTFAYVFWLQPELLNMASVMVAVFLVAHKFETPAGASYRLNRLTRVWRRLFNLETRPLWSGALLAVATYNKPVLAIAALPILYLLWRQHNLKAVARWCFAAVVAMALLAGVSIVLTGHPTAYLGVARSGVKVEDPAAMDAMIAEIKELMGERSTTANSWSWMFDPPPFAWREFFEDLRYFFWGRHTGFLLYQPLGVLAILLFLLNTPRSLPRWLLLGSTLALGVFFIVKIPLVWHGGAGFIGNRYLINVYPLLLFLVTAVRPIWTLPAACGIGGLFLGTIIFTPFGAPVPKPTLQAHVRSLPYARFPLELSIRRQIPGYTTAASTDTIFIGRSDVFKNHQPAKGYLWVQGASPVELLILTENPLDSALFAVRTWAPDNRVSLRMGGDKEVIEYANALRRPERERTVELVPDGPDRITYEYGKPFHVYKLAIETSAGRRIVDQNDRSQVFFLGAQIHFLGRRSQVGDPVHYRLRWADVASPGSVRTGADFSVEIQAQNLGKTPLRSIGPMPVFLSYHWIDSDGLRVVHGGRRTRLGIEIPPGGDLAAAVKVRAPHQPGVYRLALDAVREPVAWFSERGNPLRELEIEVVDALSSPDNPGP